MAVRPIDGEWTTRSNKVEPSFKQFVSNKNTQIIEAKRNVFFFIFPQISRINSPF